VADPRQPARRPGPVINGTPLAARLLARRGGVPFEYQVAYHVLHTEENDSPNAAAESSRPAALGKDAASTVIAARS
jgi:hypothetical protein